MAQNGFAIFFILVLASCVFGLVLSALQDWQRIVEAVTGKSGAGEEEPLVYRTIMRAPAELPIVAQRMVLHSEEEAPTPAVALSSLAARTAAARRWSAGPAPRSARQLRFHFAAAGR
jgi:hypothetical protein